MPTVSYHTLAGRIALTTVGTNRQECLPDALGSVVTTTIGGAAIGKQIRYANYGGVIYDVGGFNRPRNAWVGSLGYRSTQVSHAEQYVRARHYSTTEARWTTVDPIWPKRSSFVYCSVSPISKADRSGLSPTFSECGDVGILIDLMAEDFCNALKSNPFRTCLADCVADAWNSNWFEGELMGACMDNWCHQGHGVCVDIQAMFGFDSAGTVARVGSCTVMIDPRVAFRQLGVDIGSWINLFSHELGHCCSPLDTGDAGIGRPGLPVTTFGICNYNAGNCIQSRCAPIVSPPTAEALQQLVRRQRL